MPPVNDLWANATIITSLPFSDPTVDMATATASADDPLLGAASSDGSVNPGDTALLETVWWKWTPMVDMVVQASTTNTIPIGVLTGSPGSFVEVVSNFNFNLTTVTWQARAGVTYSIMVGIYPTRAGLGTATTVSLAASPAPPNQFMITATVISSVPFSTVADTTLATDSGWLWYTYTAPVKQVISIFPYQISADAVNGALYQGTVTYENFTPYPDNGSGVPDIGVSLPTYIGLPAGQTIYLRFFTSNGMGGGQGSFSLEILLFECQDASAGSLLQLSDVTGWPACIISQADGSNLQFPYPFPASGLIAKLADGTICTYESESNTFSIFDNQLVLQRTFPLPAPYNPDLTGDGVTNLIANTSGTFFYVGVFDGMNKSTLTLTAQGVFGLPIGPYGGITTGQLGVSPDEATLYYNTGGAAGCDVFGEFVGTPGTVGRWDIVHNVRLFPDLIPTPLPPSLPPVINPTHFAWGLRDVMVLKDGTILLAYHQSKCPVNYPGPDLFSTYILRYSPGGTLLNTYILPATALGGAQPFFARALDDPASFWISTNRDDSFAGQSWKDIFHIRISDGFVLVNFAPNEFSAGELEGPSNPTVNPPPAFFGPSDTRMVLLQTVISCGSTPPPPPENMGCPTGVPLPLGTGAACSAGVSTPSA